MTDDERAELVDLGECYRQLFAAIIHRAVQDLDLKSHRADAQYFFNSGRADYFLIVLDIAPDEFKKRLCL